MKAVDIMTKEVITVRIETPVKEVALVLTKNRISGVPVINRDNEMVGIITEADLIALDKNIHFPTAITILGGVIYLNSKSFDQDLKKVIATKAEDLMTKKVIFVSKETSLSEIATIMSEKRIHLLPVIENKKIIGIISKADIVKTIANE
ncbi:CBS domain-containing protein [bacterium]|nr:CBS domain-containing protein [bacterium]MBU1152567.1 CBS domain-containing protein [bacterium]MBU1782549.1 CBS domain-containing protein [bacterium]MBU2599320.1 CBS domain-containing protein [bacterium]